MTVVKSSNALKREEAKVWRVRSLSVTRTLHRDTSIDTKTFVNMKNDVCVSSIPIRKKVLHHAGKTMLTLKLE